MTPPFIYLFFLIFIFILDSPACVVSPRLVRRFTRTHRRCRTAAEKRCERERKRASTASVKSVAGRRLFPEEQCANTHASDLRSEMERIHMEKLKLCVLLAWPPLPVLHFCFLFCFLFSDCTSLFIVFLLGFCCQVFRFFFSVFQILFCFAIFSCFINVDRVSGMERRNTSEMAQA